MILPVRGIKNNYSKKASNKTIFCFAYQEDLDQAYAFYCSRYENISYKEFMQLGLFEFKKKLGSIPKTEPLYDIIKSRTINIASIKDKEERKYWRELRRINQKLGITHKSCHKCRKTVLSALLDSGEINTRTIQRFAGHKDISVTYSYYNYDRKSQKEQAEAIEKALSL